MAAFYCPGCGRRYGEPGVCEDDGTGLEQLGGGSPVKRPNTRHKTAAKKRAPARKRK
jgi:hypothetical protein